jgi:hypothetical protein
MSLSSQMSSEPRFFSAALYSFQLVVRYFGLAGAFMPSVYPRPEFAAAGLDLCNKAHAQRQRKKPAQMQAFLMAFALLRFLATGHCNTEQADAHKCQTNWFRHFGSGSYVLDFLSQKRLLGWGIGVIEIIR